MQLPDPPAGDPPSGEAAVAPRGLFARLVTAAVYGHAACVTLIFLGMEFVGERWWPFAILLYLPQRIFLLPLIVLLPAALLAEVSLGTYAAMAVAVIIFFWHVPFYIGMGGNLENLKLTVMTNNYGQHHGLSIAPFIAREDPDIVALDEAQYDQPQLRQENPGRTLVQTDQFVLLSKAPVKSATPLAWPLWVHAPVAAVFDIDLGGKDVAIYAVHLPTPRGDFDRLADSGLLHTLAGRDGPNGGLAAFTQSMAARVQLGRDLASVFAKETRPFIALGDFNMPPDGYVHREVSWGMLDSFEQAGRGFGFTFPGDVANPLTSSEPWLRIDYILAGPGWRAVSCSVEPDRRSQHRAVVATLTRD